MTKGTHSDVFAQFFFRVDCVISKIWSFPYFLLILIDTFLWHFHRIIHGFKSNYWNYFKSLNICLKVVEIIFQLLLETYWKHSNLKYYSQFQLPFYQINVLLNLFTLRSVGGNWGKSAANFEPTSVPAHGNVLASVHCTTGLPQT